MRNTKFYLLLILLFLAILVSLLYKKPSTSEVDFSMVSDSLSKPKVLVLELFVPLYYGAASAYSGGGIRSLINQINRATKDDKVKGLLLRVNSPGGTFGASEEFYKAMVRFHETGKPIVSSVVDLAASGGYYAILPSDLIMANRGAIIGSIGVRITTPDLTLLYKKLGIGFNQITSVKYKDILSEARKMRPEERKHLKEMMKESHEIFVSDVVQWRGQHSSEAVLRKAANGLIYSSAQARTLGLIDEFGDFEEAKLAMAKLLNTSKNDIHFYLMTEKDYLIESIFNELGVNLKSWVEGLFFESALDRPSLQLSADNYLLK